MSIRSLRTFGLVSAIGGGFALVVVLCLGVALVGALHPSHRQQDSPGWSLPRLRCPSLPAHPCLGPFGAGRALTSAGTLPSTENPVPRRHAAIDRKPCTHRHAAFG